MEKLLKASREGDIDELKRIVNSVPEDEVEDFVNSQKAVTDITALHLASRGGFLDICEYLYQYGASLDLTNTDDRTALHFAAMKGFTEVCSFLIENGAILDPRDVFQFNLSTTPLHYAIEHGYCEIVQLFADNGCDLNMLNACKCGHPEILKILIGYDVKVNAKKRGEMPPILYAINCISDSEQPDKVSECVEILVEHNADINCAFTDGEYAGETALISACRLNLPEVVKRLIEKKANISAVSKAGKTSLYYAVYNKSLDILNTLLSASPSFEDLNRKYENNKTLVHVCLYKIEQTYQANDSLKVLKVLLDQGLEPDASDSEGDTALHIAAPKKSAVELVKFLIHQGLDPQQTNKKDRTVFSIAHPAIVPVISEALMDEETIAAQQERLKYRREKEKEEMLNRRDEKINAMSKSYVRDDNERTVMINKNAKKHAQLLAMTKRNGTLRTSTPKSAKLTPVKKTEARPWGGSRQTAKFQREMRLKIRNVKKEILGELDELRKAVEDVKKRVYIEAGIISESDEGSQNEDSNFESDEQSFQNTLPPPTETPEATENVEATETPETAEATESTETPETAEATETLDTAEATESTETAEATETLEAAEATETTESSQQPQQMAQAHTEEPTENMDDTSNIIDNLLIDSNTIENNESSLSS